jgi:hypothetical protein
MQARQPTVWTIGHSTRPIDEFIDCLRAHEIRFLVDVRTIPPAYAGSHNCKTVEEYTTGVLRSLGEGGHASAGSAEDTIWATAVKPWGSTLTIQSTIQYGHIGREPEGSRFQLSPYACAWEPSKGSGGFDQQRVAQRQFSRLCRLYADGRILECTGRINDAQSARPKPDHRQSDTRLSSTNRPPSTSPTLLT